MRNLHPKERHDTSGLLKLSLKKIPAGGDDDEEIKNSQTKKI